MDQRRRDLMFRVMNDQQEVAPYLHHFDQFRRCDEMLCWLIRNRLVGKEFLTWAKFQFGVSMLDVSKDILKRLENNDQTKAIIYGKDILAN